VSERPTVVVVGSVNVDLVFRMPRLPAPGETVAGGSFQRGPGGKGANQAAAAARLGARTVFVGMVGDDELGREARADLEEAGVDASRLGIGDSPTGVAGIVVGRGGENLIAVASGANHELDAARVEDALGTIDASRAVVLANLEIPDEAVAAAGEGASRRGWPFVLNPAPARGVDAAILARCSVVVPNEGEATALGGVSALLAAGPEAVVVTLGKEGADLHRPGGATHHQPAFAVEVADTTGAGDAFCGALAFALAEGRDLESAVALAAAAGALACRAVGARASLPTGEELEAFAGPP
jgi:ribokinase